MIFPLSQEQPDPQHTQFPYLSDILKSLLIILQTLSFIQLRLTGDDHNTPCISSTYVDLSPVFECPPLSFSYLCSSLKIFCHSKTVVHNMVLFPTTCSKTLDVCYGVFFREKKFNFISLLLIDERPEKVKILTCIRSNITYWSRSIETNGRFEAEKPPTSGGPTSGGPLSGRRAAFQTPLHSLYSTRPHGLVQAIFGHTCPDPDLGPWYCLTH